MTAKTESYAVLRRIRHSKKLFEPGCEGGIPLTAEQAAPLLLVQAIADPNAAEATDGGDDGQAAALTAAAGGSKAPKKAASRKKAANQ